MSEAGRDRVAAEEERQAGQPRRGDQAPGERLVAGDLHVLARLEGRRPDLVVGLEELGRLAEVVAGPEGAGVGLDHLRLGGEALGDPLEGRVDGPGVEPADQAEREEVLGALGVAGLDAGLLADLLGDGGHRDLVDGVGAERAVGQRVGLVARLGQAALVEGVAVDDEHRALGHQVDVGLEGRRVHRHQHVRRVAGGQDVVVRDVDLEGRHAAQGAGRGPDLGREVGEGGQVVAQQGAARGEAVAGELHAVARVAGEAHDDLVQLLCRVLRSRCHGLPRLMSWTVESPGSPLRAVAHPRRHRARHSPSELLVRANPTPGARGPIFMRRSSSAARPGRGGPRAGLRVEVGAEPARRAPSGLRRS